MGEAFIYLLLLQITMSVELSKLWGIVYRNCDDSFTRV